MMERHAQEISPQRRKGRKGLRSVSVAGERPATETRPAASRQTGPAARRARRSLSCRLSRQFKKIPTLRTLRLERSGR